MFSKLKKGDTVGVIAPSSKIDKDDLEAINNSVLLMESTGLKVKFGKNEFMYFKKGLVIYEKRENCISRYRFCWNEYGIFYA